MSESAIGSSESSPPTAPPSEHSPSPLAINSRRSIRGRLLFKYVALVVVVVLVALLANGAMELWVVFRDHKASLVRIQREQASSAADKIGQFVREIEQQLGWTVQLPWSAATFEQRRVDAQRLLRQVPAITDLAQIDASGKEQLRVSRLAMDVVGSGLDISNEPQFAEALAQKVYHGPVYFRRESEPYMTLSLAGSRRDAGVSVAEVNLKFIWDVVSQITVGERGRAFVVDRQGRLIAHPDISLVLRKTDMSQLAQVHAALTRDAERPADAPREAVDLHGRKVLTASATVAPLGWLVFVELPVSEAYAPLYAAIQRTGALLLATLALALLAGAFLARRLVAPVRALSEGAARIGDGDLDQRISIRTGDELEALADQFNDMAGRLQQSYAGLELKVEARTQELSEALEHQTATSEILHVIASSPTDIQPVLEAVAESAARLCGAIDAEIFQVDGDALRLVAQHGGLPRWPIGDHRPINRKWVTGRAVADRQTIHIDDLSAAVTEYPEGASYARQYGHKTTLATPLLREGTPIGAILVRRNEVRGFTDRQVELLKTFADQAVIAIENVRLFQDLEARNREVTEALAQQTATSAVLHVISRSPTDVQPVFDMIARSVAQLCEAFDVMVLRVEGKQLRLVAHHGPMPAGDVPLVRGTLGGRTVIDGKVIHVEDLQAEAEAYPEGSAIARERGHRTTLSVPLLRDGIAIGNIQARRKYVRRFTDAQINLLKIFADQAVIAIENVRLFQELEARTEDLTRSVDQLTALAEVGQAVGSTLDLDTVLATIVSRAVELSDSYGGIIYEFDEGVQQFHARATHRITAEHLEALRAAPIRLGEGAVGRAGVAREAVEVTDIEAEFRTVAPQVQTLLAREGMRAMLALPLLREERLLGGLVMLRSEQGAFSPNVIELLKTFAAQSALAIQNARLFHELQDKSEQLTIASQHKSQFLANMSHELRTPLNAVIGFSEVLAERMFGELNEKQAEYVQDIHDSGRHLLSLINDILDLAKVEAGKMELELERFDVRAALDNALTLVKERATRNGITLQTDFPGDLGAIIADQRKFKQVLLNLLSNAVKFTAAGGRVTVAAERTGDTVFVTVADTGVGISTEEQQVIFEEFRQVGGAHESKSEGTGLGLALTKKFVELHGGRIWVESELGRGSTFGFSLPVDASEVVAMSPAGDATG